MLIYRAVLMSTIVWIATSSISLADNPVQTHSVEFLWRVSNAHQEIVKNSLKFEGDMLQDKNAKGVIYVFVGLAMLPALVDSILNLREKLVKPGITIDTRGSKILIETDANLPGGAILLVDKDGSKLMEKKEAPSPTALINAIDAALKK
jgi:hypothetical protein